MIQLILDNTFLVVFHKMTNRQLKQAVTINVSANVTAELPWNSSHFRGNYCIIISTFSVTVSFSASTALRPIFCSTRTVSSHSQEKGDSDEQQEL